MANKETPKNLSKDPIQNASPSKMEQVKLLLFGENMDEYDSRLNHLENLVESNARSFEKALLDAKNEILTEMRKNHAFALESLANNGSDKDVKIDNLTLKTNEDKKNIETNIEKIKQELLNQLNIQQTQINIAISNLDIAKAERKDIDKVFSTIRSAFEKINEVL